jgi:hypothetical protein
VQALSAGHDDGSTVGAPCGFEAGAITLGADGTSAGGDAIGAPGGTFTVPSGASAGEAIGAPVGMFTLPSGASVDGALNGAVVGVGLAMLGQAPHFQSGVDLNNPILHRSVQPVGIMICSTVPRINKLVHTDLVGLAWSGAEEGADTGVVNGHTPQLHPFKDEVLPGLQMLRHTPFV